MFVEKIDDINYVSIKILIVNIMSSFRLQKYKSEMMECVRDDLLSRLNKKYIILTEDWMSNRDRMIEQHNCRRVIQDHNMINLLILENENAVKAMDKMITMGL